MLLIYIGFDHPDMKDLLVHVIPFVAPYWEELGTQLLPSNQAHQLPIIRSNNQQDVEKCCKEVLKFWLKVQPNATWNQLVDAIKLCNLADMAGKIEIKLQSRGKNILYPIQGTCVLMLCVN